MSSSSPYPPDSAAPSPFGTGIPVIHQNELPQAVRDPFNTAFPYEPITDRFTLHAVGFRIEERWPSGEYGARVTLRTAGWRSLPNLPEELAEDEDIEDAFLGMATRLPANYIEFLTGATVKYDTNSFLREEHRAYRMEYRVRGTPEQIVAAVEALRLANDTRWKKAHMMLGYRPGGEDHSDDRARRLTDAMYGDGTAERWAAEVAAYDAGLAEYFQTHALKTLGKRQPCGHTHEVADE